MIIWRNGKPPDESDWRKHRSDFQKRLYAEGGLALWGQYELRRNQLLDHGLSWRQAFVRCLEEFPPLTEQGKQKYRALNQRERAVRQMQQNRARK